MPDVTLVVGGLQYAGWKSIRISRSIESLAGSFDLEVTDRWTDLAQYQPIAEEDPCEVRIGDEVVISGYVDRRRCSLSENERSIGFSGRDNAAVLVDCSAIPEKWSYRDTNLVSVIMALAEPFGIGVSVQTGLEVPRPPRKVVVQPGDTVFETITRVAQIAGVLVVSDGAGGILVTRAGTVRAQPIIEGQNLKAASIEYDGTERFSRYVIATQTAGTDKAHGNATRIRGEATDEGVRRTERVLLVRPESGVPLDLARRRVDWEARIRAAKAESVSATVQGWTQSDGVLWPLNALCRVQAPSIGIDGELLITQAEYGIDDRGGTATTLRLMRPDAFEPEPQRATVKANKAKKPAGAAITPQFALELAGGLGVLDPERF